MSVVYLVCFIGGLLLAVRVMIFGVERPREDHPAGERSFRLTPPVIVAFAVVFGVAGYLLTERAVAAVGVRLLVAAVLGAVAAVATAHSVRKWWQVTPEHDVDDERYVLQGHLARVTKPIGSDVDGEVAYEISGERQVVRARGIDGTMIATGAEVVIDRIEGDVAYVESWLEVEKRL